jgi:hypothetical protein
MPQPLANPRRERRLITLIQQLHTNRQHALRIRRSYKRP